MIRAEMETTVTFGVEEEVVRIYTCVPKHLRRLRNYEHATETRGGKDWGQFEIPVEFFDPLTGFKHKRKLSAAQREAASERMRAVRASQLEAVAS